MAVKQIDKSVLTDTEKEFLREEVQIIKMIHHPSIVQFKETYETEKYMLIIMEQLADGDLYEHIKNQELEEKELANVMYQILEAIQYI